MSSYRPTDPALAPYGVDTDDTYSVPVPSSTAGHKARADADRQVSQWSPDDYKKFAEGTPLSGSGTALDMDSVPPQNRLASMSKYTVPLQHVTVNDENGKDLVEDVWEQGQVTIANLGQRSDGSTLFAKYERGLGIYDASFGSTDTITVTTSRQFGAEQLPIPGESIWPGSMGEAYSATTDLSKRARRSAENLAIETFGPKSSGDGSYRR